MLPLLCLFPLCRKWSRKCSSPFRKRAGSADRKSLRERFLSPFAYPPMWQRDCVLPAKDGSDAPTKCCEPGWQPPHGSSHADPASIPLLKLRLHRILKQRAVASDNRQPRRCHEVPPLILDLVIADHRALGNINITVDDRLADAAMPPDIHMAEDDARVHAG